MNNSNITKEFNAGHVGQLAKRHEATEESRKEQQAIPYSGLTYAEEQQQRRNQSTNGGTQQS